jgi:hypothetical protein
MMRKSLPDLLLAVAIGIALGAVLFLGLASCAVLFLGLAS